MFCISRELVEVLIYNAVFHKSADELLLVLNVL